MTGDAPARDGDWARRALQLFDAASAMEEPARSSFLGAECAGDAALRAEVEALLSAGRKVPTQDLPPLARREDVSTGPVAPVSWTAAIAALPEEAPDGTQLERGQTIGRFVVLGLVGRGGMGEVYAAYDPELDRKVAVKLVRPRVSQSRDDRGRLLREAQAIAKLSHPNVVVVYDVGTIGERVFIAMEFVDGGTVGAWLESAKRSVREILDVFLAAGRGLAAAHKAGMVHRDFKPDNVMIGNDGQVRVMDFGLARQVLTEKDEKPAADPVERTIKESGAYRHAKITETGVRIGSPAYMAPEQFMGAATDERTDQFSYCVALYEALYGERPFAGETVLSLQVNVLEGTIRPAPASSRVPGWIRRILLRGITIHPGGRFPSLEALLSALGNDPARRTKNWALAGATLVAMLAVAGLTHRMGTSQRTLCTGAEAHLAGIWELGSGPSERKAAIQRAFGRSGKSYAAQAYTGIARLLDHYVERWRGMYTEACEATQVRGEQSPEVMDLRMTCLRERLGNVRALSDVFTAADGKVVENAVSAAAALPSLDRCADVGLLRAVVKPPEDPSTRKRVNELRTELARVIALRDSGQCARAIPRASALLTDTRSVGYQPLLADVLFAAAQLGNNCGDFAEMLQRFRDAHAAATASHDDEVAAQASALIPSYAINRLAQVSVAREWLGVAQGDVTRLGRETLADAMLAQAEGTLAVTDHEDGRALIAADRSIEITRRLLGPDDPLTMSWELNKGLWQETAGRLDEALQTDIQVRAHLERVLGRDHPLVALICSNEGEVLNLLHRYSEAEVAYQRALDLFRQSGAVAVYVAWTLTGLGSARIGQERPAAAVAPLEEALAIRIQDHASPPQLGETRFALARALWSRRAERKRALALALSARREYGDDKKAIAEIDAWLARAHAERS